MTDQTTPQPPINKVVAYALNATHDHNLKKGLSKHTEHYAYESVLPYLDENATPDEITLALRLAAIINDTGIPNNPETSFGKWLRNNQTSPDQTATRLKQLINMPVEEATLNIYRLINMANTKQGFNWYKLTKTLTRWGQGITENSIASRQTILRDYYLTNTTGETQND